MRGYMLLGVLANNVARSQAVVDLLCADIRDDDGGRVRRGGGRGRGGGRAIDWRILRD